MYYASERIKGYTEYSLFFGHILTDFWSFELASLLKQNKNITIKWLDKNYFLVHHDLLTIGIS